MNKKEKLEQRQYSLKSVSLIIIIVFAMMITLNSKGLLEWAERMEIGPTRDFFISVFEPLSNTADKFSLNEPRDYFSKQFKEIAGIEVDAGFDADYDPASDTSRTTKADTVKKELEIPEIVFTPKRPLKVLLIGDSMMGPGLGGMILKNLELDSLIVPVRYFKYSTGLTRIDYYNWYVKLNEIFKEEQYDAAVTIIGTNDAQDFELDRKTYYYGTDEWFAVYRTRVEAYLDSLVTHTKKVYWLGMPPMRKDRFHKRMMRLNEIYKDEVSKEPRAVYIPTTGIVGDVDNLFTSYLDYEQKRLRVRTNDGIHFTDAGGNVIAYAVIDSLRTSFIFDADPEKPDTTFRPW